MMSSHGSSGAEGLGWSKDHSVKDMINERLKNKKSYFLRGLFDKEKYVSLLFDR